MADAKLTALTALGTTPDAGDLFYMVDVSDTTDGASGTSKKVVRSDMVGGLATSGANSNITSLTGLTTPLTVAQGGTGAVTLTGILKGNGTSAFTAVTAPSGAIVGDTDTQTLTNKTLTSPTLSSPTMTTPTLGVATATSVNKVAITAPATSATLTIANGKTLTASNTLTLAGTDGTTMTFPSTTGTVATLNSAQTFSATKTFAAVVQTITAATDQATVTFDLSLGNIHTVTLGGNRTLALSNASVGQCFLVRLLQDGTGSRTVTWFSTIKWESGTTPTLTTTASKADMFGFVCTSSDNYDGFIVGQNI